MSRFLVHSLFAVALIMFASQRTWADDAEASEGETAETVAPSKATESDEKDAEAADEPSPPQPVETEETSESDETGEPADKEEVTEASPEPKPEAPKPKSPEPEAPKPETPKPEAPKPEAPKTETPKPEAPKPEAPKTETPKPDEVAEPKENEVNSASTESTAPEEELERWQELHQQWLAIDEQLKNLELKFFHSQQDQQFEIRESFERLIEEEANPLLAELRTEVINAYQAKPNEDVRLVKLLIGFMVNHARMEEEAEAKQIIELLIEHEGDEKYVMVSTKASLKPSSLEILDRMVNRYKEALMPQEGASTPSSGGGFDDSNESPQGPEKAGSEKETATEEKAVSDPAGETDD